MNISLNGKETEIKKSMTISELIRQKNLKPEKLVIEYNREILSREKWSDTVLEDGDKIEMLGFVGGG